MHFDFSVPVKKQKNSSQRVKVSFYTIVTKGVYCIADINIDGTYKAINILTGEEYIITSRSYQIKTCTCYCQQLVDNKRLQRITLDKIKKFDTPWLYLPFAPGVGMYGNIVKSKYNESYMFDLTKTFNMPTHNELAKTIFINFRNNYTEIYNNILKRYGIEQPVCDDCK